MTSRRPAHSLPGSFVKEKRSSFKPSFKGVGDALENISSGDEASFTKGHDDEPRCASFCTQDDRFNKEVDKKTGYNT